MLARDNVKVNNGSMEETASLEETAGFEEAAGMEAAAIITKDVKEADMKVTHGEYKYVLGHCNSNTAHIIIFTIYITHYGYCLLNDFAVRKLNA